MADLFTLLHELVNWWLHGWSAPVFGESIGDGKRVGVEMTIKTGDAHPIKQRPYRLPLTKRAVVEKEIDDMLNKGIIRPSYSPWASPITLVPKPDGSIRFCVDYRKLNAVTVEDSHPLPHIQDIFDALHGSSIFTTIELRSGYWQIPMDVAVGAILVQLGENKIERPVQYVSRCFRGSEKACNTCLDALEDPRKPGPRSKKRPTQ